MPTFDAYIPQGTIAPEVEHWLLAERTDIPVEWEGSDPANAVARVCLRRPEGVDVGGVPAPRRLAIVEAERDAVFS